MNDQLEINGDAIEDVNSQRSRRDIAKDHQKRIDQKHLIENMLEWGSHLGANASGELVHKFACDVYGRALTETADGYIQEKMQTIFKHGLYEFYVRLDLGNRTRLRNLITETTYAQYVRDLHTNS